NAGRAFRPARPRAAGAGPRGRRRCAGPRPAGRRLDARRSPQLRARCRPRARERHAGRRRRRAHGRVAREAPAAAMIDLRSDICAVPTDAMWEAMREARLGWATYGEDENVNELERRGAELLGKESAVLVPTCSLANLAALMAQTKPGDRVEIDPSAHILVNEGDWLTEVARLEVGEPAVVVCIENTHTRRGGTVLTAEETAELA